MTSVEVHRRAVRTFYEQVWNAHDVGCLSGLVSQDVSFRGSLGVERRGVNGLTDYVNEVHDAFESYRCELLELVADEESAAARLTFSGRHRGSVLGMAPTGRLVAWSGAAFFTFVPQVDDVNTGEVRISAIWVLGDLMSLRDQLQGGDAVSGI